MAVDLNQTGLKDGGTADHFGPHLVGQGEVVRGLVDEAVGRNRIDLAHHQRLTFLSQSREKEGDLLVLT